MVAKSKIKKSLLLFLLIFFIVFNTAISVFGAVFYVDGGISESADGSSWQNAFLTIQEAVDAAGDIGSVDEIWVKRGTYLLNSTIQIDTGIELYGGFNGTETNRLSRDPKPNLTIIDGNNTVQCISSTAKLTLDGFTIMNGTTDSSGGGAYLEDGGEISDCVFLNNYAELDGGGLYNDNSFGINTVINTVFQGNEAGDDGGGMVNKNILKLTNCIFNGNSAGDLGGGVFTGLSGVAYGVSVRTINETINCTFYNNSAGTSGGGVYYFGAYIPNYQELGIIQNSILWGNTAPSNPEVGSGFVTEVVEYTNITGGHEGDGNKSADPLFEDVNSGAFRLQTGSPCIDTGNNEVDDIPDTDLDKKLRILDGDLDGTATIDMGAFEHGRYVIVNQPNGSEYWLGTNTPSTITWVEGDVGETVKIEISRDGGNTWTVIAASTENDGRYDWPLQSPASSFCRVRVSAIDDASVMDISDGDFTIDLDSDNDGMLDLWEERMFGNLANDGTADSDDDTLTDKTEYDQRTHPLKVDTDMDERPDDTDTDPLKGVWSAVSLPGRPSGEYVAMAVDPQNNIHICSYSRYNGLLYLTNASGNWVSETVDESESGSWCDLAVDSEGFVHISFNNETEDTLNYVTNKTGQWDVQTVDSSGGLFSSIAADSADRVHISYYDQDQNNLKYAFKDGDQWTVSTLDDDGIPGRETCLAIDSDGKAHIAYLKKFAEIDTDGSPYSAPHVIYDIKYITLVNSEWRAEVLGQLTIMSTLNSTRKMALVIDYQVHPQIVYYDDDATSLNLLSFNGNSWQKQIVDSSAGQAPALAIDKDNNLHIGYWDGDQIAYTNNVSGFWHKLTGISFDDSGYHNAMLIDHNGNIHASCMVGRNPDYSGLCYLNNVAPFSYALSGEWSYEVIEKSRDGIDICENIDISPGKVTIEQEDKALFIKIEGISYQGEDMGTQFTTFIEGDSATFSDSEYLPAMTISPGVTAYNGILRFNCDLSFLSATQAEATMSYTFDFDLGAICTASARISLTNQTPSGTPSGTSGGGGGGGGCFIANLTP